MRNQNEYDRMIRSMRTFALMAFFLLVYLLYGAALRASPAPPYVTARPLYEVAPLPATPSFETDPTIAAMTTGIVRTKRAAGVWFECGRQVPRAEWSARAREWAEEIWVRHVETGVSLRDFLAIPAQESGFDPCALGPQPRDWAYQHGYLRPSRRTLSHNRADIAAFLGSAAWRRDTGGVADVGGYQVLHPKYTGRTRGRDLQALPPALARDPDYLRALSTAEILTVAGSVLSGARQLVIRAARFRTDRPGACWPGHYSVAYRAKLDRWVDRVMRLEGVL